MKLLVFAASHRTQSVNRRLVGIAAAIASESGAEIDFPEYAELDMPIYDDELFDGKNLPTAAAHFVSRLTKADGVVLSSPEYNWSFPGSLKNIIDWASVVKPNPFKGKTALLLSASPSLRGGAQGLVHLKLPLESLGMFVFPQIFAVARAEEAFDGQEGLKDPKLRQELARLVGEFIGMTAAVGRRGNK